MQNYRLQMSKYVVGKGCTACGKIAGVGDGNKLSVKVVRKLQGTPCKNLIFVVIGGVDGIVIFGDLGAVAVGVENP